MTFAVLTPLSAQFLYSPRYLDFPSGRTAMFDPDWTEVFEWFLHRTTPREYCLAVSRLNFYLQLRNPADGPFLSTTDFTRPAQVTATLEELQRRRVRLVLWWPDPGPDDPTLREDHLGPLRDYVRQHYQVVKTFFDGDVTVWERKP